jgi:stage IV sporulation protein FB
VLGRSDLIRSLKQLGPEARVADAMTSNIPSIGERRCLEDAFRLLQEKSAPAVAVVDATGRLVGLVTSETVGEMLMLRKALPEGVRLGPWTRRSQG